jgi:hypothetical protein
MTFETVSKINRRDAWPSDCASWFQSTCSSTAWTIYSCLYSLRDGSVVKHGVKQMKTSIRLALFVALLTTGALPALAMGKPPHGPGGGIYGAPGPIVGVGLPIIGVGLGAYWLIRRYRRKSG